jgi:hypothetical protein
MAITTIRCEAELDIALDYDKNKEVIILTGGYFPGFSCSVDNSTLVIDYQKDPPEPYKKTHTRTYYIAMIAMIASFFLFSPTVSIIIGVVASVISLFEFHSEEREKKYQVTIPSKCYLSSIRMECGILKIMSPVVLNHSSLSLILSESGSLYFPSDESPYEEVNIVIKRGGDRGEIITERRGKQCLVTGDVKKCLLK